MTNAPARNSLAMYVPVGAVPLCGCAESGAGSPLRAIASTAAASARFSAPARRMVPGMPSQPSSQNAAASAPIAAPIELVKYSIAR